MVSDLAPPKSSGHFGRLSSLPSIEEHNKDLSNKSVTRPSHRRAPSASSSHHIGNKPRFSLKSIGSEPSHNSSDSHSTASITSKDLLANMMQSHRDRDPYQYYTVLELIGQGSIGSVEKVVKKHHSLRSHTNLNETHNHKKSFILAGIFHDCCVVAYDDEHDDKHTNTKGHRREQSAIKSLFGNFLSKLSSSVSHSNTDVFQSITFKPSPANTDSNRSIISENSCFSAPTVDVRPHLGSDFSKFDELLANHSSHGHRGWNSIRSDNSSLHHSPQHALRRYALKSIRLDRTEQNSNGNAPSNADEAELRNEIAILRSLDHPHIVHIIETYEYRRSIYLLIDLCEGGDLYVMDPYSESEARAIMKQLCQAVSYMHRKGVVHRDLKYENVMFVDCANRSRMSIKIIDFGLSMKYGAGGSKKSMTDFVGTIYTMAPEVIRGNYTHKCDLWSLGVMAYMLLSSQIPFVGRDMTEIAKEIMRCRYSFSGRRWHKISKQGKDFIDSLLVRDPSRRPNADQALQHQWLKDALSPPRKELHRRHSSDCVGTAYGMTKMAPYLSLDYQICKSMENFSTYSWLHRLALMVIGYKYTGKETAALREVFASFDYKNTGTVEVDELRHAFSLYDKYSDEEIDQIFAAVDMNGTGLISWTEFLAATIEVIGTIGEEEFDECFDRLDCDSSGYISTQNLKEIVGDLPDHVFDRIIDESDITRDHKIWRHEFMALLDERVYDNSRNDHRKPLHFVFKRSNSVGDLDFLAKLNADFSSSARSEASSEEGGHNEVFNKEKAKSVRKMSKFK